MPENPGAYSEARDRIREKKEKETVLAESKKENFEKEKTILRKKKSLDVRGLRSHIETGSSLDLLKAEIKEALKEGTISRDTYNQVIASIEGGEKQANNEPGIIDPSVLPFSQNKLARYLENQVLGDNIGVDMVGFLYGLVIQGSAILVIIAWKILTDFLFLPRDIYRTITQK